MDRLSNLWEPVRRHNSFNLTHSTYYVPALEPGTEHDRQVTWNWGHSPRGAPG